jgi:hypothetical protein
MLSTSVLMADFEFTGGLDTNLVITDLTDNQNTQMRTTLNLRMKSDFFIEKLYIETGVDYSKELKEVDTIEPLSVDQLYGNNKANINTIDLTYINDFSFFEEDFNYGIKAGRMENKTIFTNYYNEDKIATGFNKTFIEGIASQLNWRDYNLYGIAFNKMNKHENITETETVKGVSLGVDGGLKMINFSLNGLFVNYDERDKKSDLQLLAQVDATFKDNEVALDYLQTEKTLLEPTKIIGVSGKIDWKFPIKIAVTKKEGKIENNFDGSIESPVRTLGSLSTKMLHVQDALTTLKNKDILDENIAKGFVNDSDLKEYEKFDEVLIGVEVDLSKVMNMKKETLQLTLKKLDTITIPQIEYKDVFFEDIYTHLNFGQYVSIDTIKKELDTTDLMLSGSIKYKW